MKYAFGADVGGTTVKLGFFFEEGTLIEVGDPHPDGKRGLRHPAGHCGGH